ncbi:hypothetical protein CKN73_02215 [Carnobacterium divergens]|uniref:VOC family protein n=1 Tax=Carnobacterium divergens TaxID=2748 RepID=UPI00107251E4|nr:VOC family protein [Carnobacterium divergens]TFJ44376.1 hypothetical protein CKN77_02190 [Carnobacterium divergens]TFJ52347.1 hypothetical protein CKN73_02215 [Carnobacterium divergens]TFJ57513.1 hypothetical protein CKN83_02205 [Carnobacterium divergens]TFJ65939.1 hypothetical protein CKN89_02215 [Carnobacterium divergens]TFJ74244.1 hypothetical protein CKN91_02210 [Carnobacterium divergens]
MNQTLEIGIFLSMNGKAQEAITFYKKHLYAKEQFKITYEEMAERDSSLLVTEENKQFISHSVLTIGKTKVMIAEESMNLERRFQIGNNLSLCIQSADLQQIQQFYTNLVSEPQVKVIVPLSSNAFSEAYGVIQDPFGVLIQLNHDERL